MKKKARKSITVLIIILLVCTGGVAGYCIVSNSFSQSPNLSPEDYYVVGEQAIQRVVSAEGTIGPSCYINCYSRASGLITNIMYSVGDYVSQGTTLCEIDKSDLELQILRQEKTVESNEWQSKQVYGNEREVRRLALEDSELVLQDLRNQLRNYSIITPTSGLLTEVKYSINDYCNKNDLVFVIANIDKYKIEVEIYEDDITSIYWGQQVQITVPATGEFLYGRVNRISDIGKCENGITTYSVVIEIDSFDINHLFMIGMNARVQIVVAEKENAIVIPSRIITEEQKVFVLSNNEVVSGSYVDVEIGISDGEYVEIIYGLNVNDRILLNPEKFGV